MVFIFSLHNSDPYLIEECYMVPQKFRRFQDNKEYGKILEASSCKRILVTLSTFQSRKEKEAYMLT